MQIANSQADIVFRVDSSPIMGVGHIMRCVTLANALSKVGFVCEFVCRAFNRNYSGFIKDQGYKVNLLPLKTGFVQTKDNSTWLGDRQKLDAEESLNIYPMESRPRLFIVDHYSISVDWEKAIANHGINLIVIDDLENRIHECNVLIDTTFNRQPTKYRELCGPSTKLLLGSGYCMLKPEFKLLRSQALLKRKSTYSIGSVLINFGGSDPDKLTLQAVKALRNEEFQGDITIIITSACEWLDELMSKIDQHDNCHLHIDSKVVHHLMLQADLAIGSTGTSTWERCCLGLPTIAIITADNQKDISESLRGEGALISILEGNLEETVKNILTSNEGFGWWYDMSDKAFSICDGAGVDRIVKEVERLL